jgi:hypothetical protein
LIDSHYAFVIIIIITRTQFINHQDSATSRSSRMQAYQPGLGRGEVESPVWRESGGLFPIRTESFVASLLSHSMQIS